MNAAERVKKRKRYDGGYEDDGNSEENDGSSEEDDDNSEEDFGPPPPKRQRAPAQAPTVPPAPAPAAKRKRGPQRKWTRAENVVVRRIMKALVDERDHPSNRGRKLWPGETKFAETSRQLALQGIIRTPNAVKNHWNRGLREESGVEERLKARGTKMTTGLRK